MRKVKRESLIVGLILVFASACGTKENDQQPTAEMKLPIFGERYYDEEIKDTVFHTIPDFELVNTDSATVTQKDFEGKIIIADFFFTSCQTICPKMTSQLKRVAKLIEEMDEVIIVSHTVDPSIDSVATLKQYAESNGINTKKWWFLTGEEEFIHEHGGQGYLLVAGKDATAQGGFLHSEKFVLVDKSKRIRGCYDGTSTTEVDRLIEELKTLRNEYKK